MDPARAIPLHIERRFDERLRIALEAMPVAVSWARIGDLRIEFTNRKFTELFGYQTEDLPTIAHWFERAYTTPEDRERVTHAWRMATEGRTQPEGELEPIEVDVLCGDGTVRSVIHGGVVLPDAGWLLATFVDISARKREETVLRRQSREDALTRLPNRRALDETLDRLLARAGRDGRPLIMLSIDLDGFKQVNDHHGHDVGDAVLCEAARRLEVCLRPTDFVARLGGDEFVALVFGLQTDEVAETMGARILEALHEPITVDATTLRIGASVGIATATGDVDASALLQNADRALYRAKAGGRGRVSR